jgi:4-azaleucine resistance transporter AzlC
MQSQKEIILFSLKATIPVFLGYLAIGIAFGLMMSTAGFSPWLALLMSITIYAGAGQYLGVSLLANTTSLGTLGLLTFLVNARHMAYGISLIDRFKPWKTLRLYLMFALTDETYALFTGLTIPPQLNQKRVHGWIALFNHFWWVSGTLIGAISGTLLPIPTQGIEFSLTALFAVLVTDRWIERKETVSIGIGILSAVIAGLVFGSDSILLPALGLGILTLFISGHFSPEHPQEESI